MSARVWEPTVDGREQPIDRNLFRDWGLIGGPYVVKWKYRGKRMRKNLGVLSSDRVAREERDKVMGLAPTKRPVTKRRTMGDLRTAYWADHNGGHIPEDKRWKPATKRKNDQIYPKWIETFLPDHLRLSDVDHERHLEPMLEAMARDLAPRTVVRNWAIVTGMFSYSARRGWSDNPTVRVREEVRPSQGGKADRAVTEEKVLTPEGLSALLATFSEDGRQRTSPNWPTIIRLAVKTGMRISEVLGLCWDQIEDGYITVDRQLAERFTAKEPSTWLAAVKNEKSVGGKFKRGQGRKIRIQPDVERLLREHRRDARHVSLAHPDGHVLVFCTYNGTPHGQEAACRTFTQGLEDAGLSDKPWTFHCLRHTYASERFSKGASYEDVALALGDTFEVTKDTYIHLHDRTHREEIEAEQYARSFIAAV